jgi:hypothetical protein
MFYETGALPKTRKEVIAYLREKENQKLGLKLIKIQDNMQLHMKDIARKPEHYLFLLEEFLRKACP